MKKYQNFYLKIFLFLVVKFSIYLNRRVFVMPKQVRISHGKQAIGVRAIEVRLYCTNYPSYSSTKSCVQY